MKYKFRYEITALDLWKIAMRNMYRSVAGVCNIVFTVTVLLPKRILGDRKAEFLEFVEEKKYN